MLKIQSRVKSQKNEMRAVLIFDHLNDVLFVKCNKKFASHILKLAKMQGLLGDDKVITLRFNNNDLMINFVKFITSYRTV